MNELERAKVEFLEASVCITCKRKMTVVLKVQMSCEGCSGAVKRVLSKMEGVESFDVDLKEQKVTVKGNVNPEEVLQTVSRTGKKTEFWQVESESKEAASAASESEAKETTAAAVTA